VQLWRVFGHMQDSQPAPCGPRSVPMANDVIVKSRISVEAKSGLQRLAAGRQIPESALVREMIEAAVRLTIPAGIGTPMPPNVRRNERLYVRLAPADRVLLADRAAARAMPSATYVSVLVRSHLRGVTPLPKEELLALKRSIADLGVVVRCLQQILKGIQLGKAPATGREVFAQTHKIAGALWERFRELLKANERSWAEGHRAPDR
jgi:hypothetical protein